MPGISDAYIIFATIGRFGAGKTLVWSVAKLTGKIFIILFHIFLKKR